MVFSMSVIMSGVVTIVNTGIEGNFFNRYFNSWTFTFPIAIVAAYIIKPMAKILANNIASKD
jgi:phosphate/sulfate permease|tara:strand:- start:264 stop:449 length:186 start_codon:yes stop_codon:yes gene_type:complete